MNNKVSPDGKYLIVIHYTINGKQYPKFYTYQGHILKMDNPKKGQFVRLPYGDFFKIVGLGTEYSVYDGTYTPAVYLVEKPEEGFAWKS